MKRCLDLIRLVLLSPEILGLVVLASVYAYAPQIFGVLVKPMRESFGFGLSAAALASGALAFSYKEGADILDPSGAKSVLLEWPGYFMLKGRIIAALCWSGVGVGAALVATWQVAMGVQPQFGAALLVGGVLVSAIAAASTGVARLRIRELLRPK